MRACTAAMAIIPLALPMSVSAQSCDSPAEGNVVRIVYRSPPAGPEDVRVVLVSRADTGVTFRRTADAAVEFIPRTMVVRMLRRCPMPRRERASLGSIVGVFGGAAVGALADVAEDFEFGGHNYFPFVVGGAALGFLGGAVANVMHWESVPLEGAVSPDPDGWQIQLSIPIG